MDIRNIGIFAHVDSGKTTLTEQILRYCGVIRRAGSVDNGDTVTDSLEIERRRGISVRSASVSFVIPGTDTRVNLIDTPGHVDFAGEVERSMTALDGAAVIVDAVEGVQPHTVAIWKALDKLDLPRFVFINKIDRAGSDHRRVFSELSKWLGGVPFVLLSAVGNEGGRGCSSDMELTSERVCEALADADDEAAERYLSGGTMDEGYMTGKIAAASRAGKLIPVFCGAAAIGIGTDQALWGIKNCLPPAGTSEKQLSGIIFAIDHDKTLGKIAYARIFGGEASSRLCPTVIRDGKDTGSVSKITQIRRSVGSKYEDIGKVTAGDIAALCGLPDVKIGDVIGEISQRTGVSPTIASPYLTVRVSPPSDDKLTPLIEALRELTDEEPHLKMRWEKTEREVDIDLTGQVQLEILDSMLKSRYGIEAAFSPPSVIYKETPTRSGRAFSCYTMPKPCWAIVEMRFDPLPRGSGVQWDGGNVPHNQLFYKYQEHIRRSFFMSLSQGNFGWEVTDFKATLTGGEHHTIHTHPLDFFVATPMAVMDGLANCGTTLLEPLVDARITAPEEYLGKIIGDVTNMRGSFDTPEMINGSFMLEAVLPVSECMDYPIKLASETAGKGRYYQQFKGYREIPPELGKTTPWRGICPRDTAKWILYARGAITEAL